MLKANNFNFNIYEKGNKKQEVGGRTIDSVHR